MKSIFTFNSRGQKGSGQRGLLRASICRNFWREKRNQFDRTKGIQDKFREVKRLLVHSEKINRPSCWDFLVRCLSWWSQVHVSSGCLATFPSVWVDERPPTSQTFSLWENFWGSTSGKRRSPIASCKHLFRGDFLREKSPWKHLTKATKSEKQKLCEPLRREYTGMKGALQMRTQSSLTCDFFAIYLLP